MFKKQLIIAKNPRVNARKMVALLEKSIMVVEITNFLYVVMNMILVNVILTRRAKVQKHDGIKLILNFAKWWSVKNIFSRK